MAASYQVFILLGVTLAAFVWGRFRYDLVAVAALLVAVTLGLVPADEAFMGFGHPAVITVAAVLVLSRGFERSGLVDMIAEQALKAGNHLMLQLLVLTGVVMVLSAVMNNVGALALLLPVALRMAREHNISPSLLLMPLAFASMLGGLMTLIGTPPNIIIANYRATQTGEAFGMFSFFPVGAVVGVVGLAFIILLGWRLVPQRASKASTEAMFETANYLVELRVDEESRANGWSLRELRRQLEEPMPILAVIRDEKRHPGHAFMGQLQADDLLLVEAGPDEMATLADKAGLKLGRREDDNEADEPDEAEDGNGEEAKKRKVDTEDLQLVEAVVRNDSVMVNRTVNQLRLQNQHGLHLVAVARDGVRLKQRLRDIRFQSGDVLLLQGDEGEISEGLAALDCLPLASRNLTIGQPRLLMLSIAIFALAIVAMLMDFMTSAVALSTAAVISLLIGVLPLRDAYKAIDGSIIVLLAAMIPVGQALETSGGASMVADAMLSLGNQWPPVVTLVALFVITMMLSDVINNAAATVLMAPIAASLANGFGASIDPFLMVVAVSASCAFLTPIGHQSNTLVMGPGGYRFGDYWRMGLPLELLIIAVAIPMILLVWPL